LFIVTFMYKGQRGVAHLPLMILVVIVLGAISFVGYKVFNNQSKVSTSQTASSRKTNPDATLPTLSQSQHDPYEGWKAYFSNTEKLSFKYPTDWTSTDYGDRTATGKADSVEFFSSSKQVAVFWNSQLGGQGGGCDATVFPGSPEAKNNNPGACPYFKVLDKQNTDVKNLFYVGGIVTRDGIHYLPWMVLQDKSGLLESRGSMGYLDFPGKNNSYMDTYGHTIQTDAELIGGINGLGSFGDGNNQGNLNESDATNFFSTAEAKQAKLILMSVSYSN
jgi:hypothetical protein